MQQCLPLNNLDLESVRQILKRYVTIGDETESQMGMQKGEEYEFVDVYWPIPSLQVCIYRLVTTMYNVMLRRLD